MRNMTALWAIAGALILVAAASGCAQIEQGRAYAGEGAGRAILAECQLSAGQRRKNLDATNDWLADNGHVARAMALDCDGDGASDDL